MEPMEPVKISRIEWIWPDFLNGGKISFVILAFLLISARFSFAEVLSDKEKVLKSSTVTSSMVSKEVKPTKTSTVAGSAKKQSAVTVDKKETKENKNSKKYEFPNPDLPEEKEDFLAKSITGRASAISFSGVAIEYQDDPTHEAWFPFVKGVKFSNIQNYKAISEGDTVRVTYKEFVKSHKKVAGEIALIKKAPKEEEVDSSLAASPSALTLAVKGLTQNAK